MRWFLPSWNGDFRIEAAGDSETCLLSVVNPTPHEKEILTDFLAKARKNGWTSATEASFDKASVASVILKAPVEKVGPLLVKQIRPQRTTLTAVKYGEGKLEVVEGVDEKAVAELEEKTKKEKEPEAAVSVKRPTPCCPSCIRGAIEPASEVLLTFLSPEQHRDWARHRAIEVEGHQSGHRYLVAHRHSKLARKFGKVCFDADDAAVLHFHDWSVPPEEEVLATKLILENREPWLRNEATCLGLRVKDVFKNPFGDVQDGRPDAIFTEVLGGGLAGALLQHGLRRET